MVSGQLCNLKSVRRRLTKGIKTNAMKYPELVDMAYNNIMNENLKSKPSNSGGTSYNSSKGDKASS